MKLTIFKADPDDRDEFVTLWAEFLKEHESIGSDAAATKRSLGFYVRLFNAYTFGDVPGVAFLAYMDGAPAGALLWGGVGEIPLDRVQPDTVNGWGAYTVPEFRRQGVSRALREAAIVALAEMGQRECVGTALLANKGGVETSRRVGFVPTMLFGTLDLQAEADKINQRRAFTESDAPITDGFYWTDGDCPLCGSKATGEAQ